MLEVYDKEGNIKKIGEETDIELKLDKNASLIEELPTSSKDSSMLFQVGKNITVGSVTIPQYARGILINNGNSNDMVLMAVDSLQNLYLGFRNTLKWYVRKI